MSSMKKRPDTQDPKWENTASLSQKRCFKSRPVRKGGGGGGSGQKRKFCMGHSEKQIQKEGKKDSSAAENLGKVLKKGIGKGKGKKTGQSLNSWETRLVDGGTPE